MCGATWPAQRVHAVFPNVAEICPRCGTDVESSLHAFWQCPANASIESETIQKTQYLIQTAISKSLEEAAFWLRGILPSHYTDIEPEYLPSPVLKPVSTTHTDDEFWKNKNHGVFYGDASGGTFSSFPAIRRIGCGIVQIDNEGNQLWGHNFNLPGPVQTATG